MPSRSRRRREVAAPATGKGTASGGTSSVQAPAGRGVEMTTVMPALKAPTLGVSCRKAPAIMLGGAYRNYVIELFKKVQIPYFIQF